MIEEMLMVMAVWGAIHYVLRYFFFRPGILPPALFTFGVYIIFSTTRALGGADGGSINWADGFTFMLIPAFVVFCADMIWTKGGRRRAES